MTNLVEDIPELTHRYTFVQGDRTRFEKAAMRMWFRHTPGLWKVMAFEAVLLVAASIAMGWWWLLALIPLMFAFFATVTWTRTRRGNRQVDPGNEVAAGYGESVIRMVDTTGQVIFPYTAFKKVYLVDGWVGLRFQKGRLVLLPSQVCPPDTVAVIEDKVAAGLAVSRPRGATPSP